MTILYLDCHAGISGDMTVAALLDLGTPLDYLQTELAKLALPAGSYRLSCSATERHGIKGCLFSVTAADEQHHRHYADIDRMIAESGLSARAIELARRVFRRLAEAEALVHGVAIADVHFHEVGAIDSIVDIAGAAICLDYLQVNTIYAAPLPLGGGFIDTAHGRLPVPAPATAELFKGRAVHGMCGAGERVTPTGAALVAALAEPESNRPEMTITAIGTGAGTKDFPDCPNILRAFIGNAPMTDDQLLVAESNIDDSSPQLLGYAMERLLAAGALDVWFTAIQMKKNRPGVMLSFLCNSLQLEELCSIVLHETSSIGIRHYPVSRSVLERTIDTVTTPFGPVRCKTVTDHSGIIRSMPEYDDCRAIAAAEKLPLSEVMQMVTAQRLEQR